jgi:hypothetical protein
LTIIAICIGIVLTICVTISIFPNQTIDRFNTAVTNATQFVDNEDGNKKQPSGTASERFIFWKVAISNCFCVMSKYRKINNNKGIAIQEPFAPTIKLALSADNADSASNTLSVLLKFVSNDNKILIPAISMEKSPYMIE